MSHFETVHEETRDGFDIALAFAPEYDAPDWDFESDEERAETLRKIENGSLLWFVARVTASRAGTVLGTDYLGGCCYASAEEFMAPDGYYPDMVDAAIGEAREHLKRLGVRA